MNNTELIAAARKQIAEDGTTDSGGTFSWAIMYGALADALEAAEKRRVVAERQRVAANNAVAAACRAASDACRERDALAERIASAKIRMREIGATDTTVYEILTIPSVQP